MQETQTCGNATALLSPFKGQGLSKHAESRIRLLSHVYTDPAHRGKGEGSKLLKQINLGADIHGLALILKPEPYAESPMDTDQLIAWYGKHGFTTLQQEPELLLYRKPRGLNGATERIQG